MVEEPGRGWRKVVASPKPTRILNSRLLKRMIEDGAVIIAGGGGGIPVYEDVGGYFRGVEAVDQVYEDYYKKANKSFTKVPDVRNMPGMDAISLLENMGFKVNFNGIGKVITQSIKAGSELKKGEIIKLDLS